MNPDQRPNKDPPPPPFVPSDEWIDALAAQCHNGLFECARRFAERRACGVGKAGHPADDYYARELVHDAIADTALGVLHWDPNVKTLERHVYDVIQMRTNYDLKRARKFRRESLDALTTNGEPSAMAEVDAALLDRASDASAETTARAAEGMAALRQLATGDRLVLGLLDASASGATSKVDLMRITGFSSAEYLNGRRRLRRLVAQLSSLHSPANKGD